MREPGYHVECFGVGSMCPHSATLFQKVNFMADQSGSGATGILGVIIGAVLVVGLGFMFLGGNFSPKAPGDTINIEVPKPDAK